jgi:hypothetical protein
MPIRNPRKRSSSTYMAKNQQEHQMIFACVLMNLYMGWSTCLDPSSAGMCLLFVLQFGERIIGESMQGSVARKVGGRVFMRSVFFGSNWYTLVGQACFSNGTLWLGPLKLFTNYSYWKFVTV